MSKTILTERNISLLLENRIRNDEDQCWIYHGYRDKDGYGVMNFTNKDKTMFKCKAHRIAYMYANDIEELDESQHVLHSCDNPPCVNPNHLFLGDWVINNKDRDNKGRNMKGEKHWNNLLTTEQILEIRRRYTSYRYSQIRLAKIYNVSKYCIYNIVNYRTWKHLK
jgi:hypothetical protein